MKILMMSPEGDGFGIAHKLVEEGNDVRVWVKERKFNNALDGVVEHVSGWRPSASHWADLVIADMVGMGKWATVLDGFEVIHMGFNLLADVAELDRHKQMELLENSDVSMPQTWRFESPGAAEELLKNWIEPGYVLKPSGNIATGKTIVAHNRNDYKWALEQYTGDQDLVVQAFVNGVEISTEGWFNGKGWLHPFNHTMEEKRFMPGNVGPHVGCMGNVVWPVKHGAKDKFVDELKKLTPFLQAINYVGPIDLNCIANENGIYALELTVRFGYDALEALYELMTEPLSRLLMQLAAGAEPEQMELKNEMAIAVRLSVPPYPHEEPNKQDRGLPVKLPSNLKHYYLTDVHKNGNDFEWSASDGVLMKVGASGKDIKTLRRNVESAIAKVQVQGVQYRNDIGLRVEKDRKMLKKWKYLG